MPDGVTTAPRPRRVRLGRGSTLLPLRRVELADLDSLGHVNNSRWVDLVQQSVFSALAASGWQATWKPEADRLRMVGIDVEYRSEAVYGQTLKAAVAVTETAQAQAAITVEISADGTAAVCANTTWRWSQEHLSRDVRQVLSALAS